MKLTLRAYYFALLATFCFTPHIPVKAQLISHNKIASFSVDQLEARWKDKSIPKIILPVNNSVDVYDISYYTTYGDGSQVIASGLYYFPENNELDSHPLMIYNHGTNIIRERELGFNGEEQVALIFSADGYGVAMPDYVGLGRGERLHLYVHADSEANAGIDLMKAVDELEEKLKLQKRNEKLFISGYSQGGHACMAVHKKLQSDFPEYPVTASSPMSGPYDLAEIQAQVMFHEYSQPHYLPYLLIGYNEIYDLFDKETFFDVVFKEPYNKIVPEIFDFNHSKRDVNEALPLVPEDMVSDSLVHLFKCAHEFKFRDALEENNVYDWKPKAPVQFCYCENDEVVLAENSLLAEKTMKENGAQDIYLKHVGRKFSHHECADLAVVYTKFFFDSFKKDKKNGRKGPLTKRVTVGVAKWFR